MKKNKLRILMLEVSFLISLIPIVHSVLEFKYDRVIAMPIYLSIIVYLFGCIIPLIYYLKSVFNREEEDDGTRFIYSLFFFAMVFNRNLISRISPYLNAKINGYSILKAYLNYFSVGIIFLVILFIYLIYKLIKKQVLEHK